VKLLDFDRTMRKLLPYFSGHMGEDFVGALAFSACDREYAASSGKEVLEIEGETNMLHVMLGCPAGVPPVALRATPMMQTLLDRCLPLPLPSLHLNMI
jgi:hypothetical protein